MYEGTRYSGFQVQPNAPTVQGELERALATICGEPVRVTGAGRTDAGVHATGQVINFRTATSAGPEEIGKGVNALLPADIAIAEVERVDDRFHARYSATGRAYEYRIRNAPQREPLERLREHWHPQALDVGAMRGAARCLVGRRDFAAFAAGQAGVREVRRADWRAEGKLLRFEIEADAFLRGMVRGIVGTLLWVGRGKLSVEEFERVTNGGVRAAAGPAAPAQGLCLVRVDYENEARMVAESESDE